MKLVIDRAKWYRGQGSGDSALLLGDGTMCCLGFYAKALGAADRDILGVIDPKGPSVREVFPDWCYYANVPVPSRKRVSDDILALVEINDDPNHEKTREVRIKEIFAKHGIEVEFIG